MKATSRNLVTFVRGCSVRRFSVRTILWRDARGSEIAEAALVLPLMFTVLLGIFWFGQAFRIYGTIAHAARQAARAGAAPVCTTCASGATVPANAYNAIQAAFAAAHLDTNKLKRPTTVPVLKSCDSNITGNVACDPSQAKICVQPSVQLSSTAGTTAAGVCGVSVTFQYPYQFWFPGTSLNNQVIQLQGAARMRSETH